MRRYLVIIIIAVQLAGCTSVKALFAMAKSTDHFLEYSENPAIFYEQGSEQYAALIAPQLNTAIQVIESKQYAVFPNEVSVYIPGSIDSFSSYCASEIPRACVIGDRLFLSPKLFKEDRHVSGILIHELSHLQLSQYLGRWNYQLNVPSWFAEGLASYVSGGAGAENATRADAIQAIKSGVSIVPNGSGSLLFPKTASDFGLEPHMFYRQSSMYVEWLHDTDEVRFKQLLVSLHADNTVEQAMFESYGFSVADGWQRFVQEISSNQARQHEVRFAS